MPDKSLTSQHPDVRRQRIWAVGGCELFRPRRGCPVLARPEPRPGGGGGLRAQMIIKAPMPLRMVRAGQRSGREAPGSERCNRTEQRRSRCDVIAPRAGTVYVIDTFQAGSMSVLAG